MWVGLDRRPALGGIDDADAESPRIVSALIRILPPPRLRAEIADSFARRLRQAPVKASVHGVHTFGAGDSFASGMWRDSAYSVGERRREIGVRMALGEERGAIARMILSKGLGLTLIGVALGVAGGIAATRLIEGMLFGVTPYDATTFVGAGTSARRSRSGRQLSSVEASGEDGCGCVFELGVTLRSSHFHERVLRRLRAEIAEGFREGYARRHQTCRP